MNIFTHFDLDGLYYGLYFFSLYFYRMVRTVPVPWRSTLCLVFRYVRYRLGFAIVLRIETIMYAVIFFYYTTLYLYLITRLQALKKVQRFAYTNVPFILKILSILLIAL